ncbi:MAG: adenylate/guanylate cyclase domain-containing protein [Hyphomicrobiales bacterium]
MGPVERLKRLEKRAAHFEAADLAARLLEGYEPGGTSRPRRARGGDNDDGRPLTDQEVLEVSYLHVLAVARSGAIEPAKQLYESYGIGDRDDEDSQSLRGRLLKDEAFEAAADDRQRLLKSAADEYARVYKKFEGSFPSVNAATLYLLAGDDAAAHRWAETTLEACAREQPGSEVGKYYREASIAEALLVKGDAEGAQAALERAGRFEAVEYAARSTTVRQLTMICEARGIDPALLRPIAVPYVLYFAGHIISLPDEPGRFPAEQEEQVRHEIDRFLDAEKPSVAYGSLAAGADIMFAEACIEKGIEVHVVLPFNIWNFIAVSVRPAGREWVERFVRCLQKAREGDGSAVRVSYATDGKFLSDESLFMYGAELAMGLALLRADGLSTGLKMAVVYDEQGGSGVGTDGSITAWTDLGLPYHVIATRGSTGPRPAGEQMRPEGRRRRDPRAILFGDVVGFSKLKEEDVPDFHDKFMKRISDTLKTFGENVLYRNSWGDAIYVVFDDAVQAARFALSIQDIIEKMNYTPKGTNKTLSLRLGGHFGPIYQGRDQLCEVETYYGSHVTRAARIEPVTPPGKVYVTEPMAAALALSGSAEVECEYVGPVPLAKDYGEIRMYQLKERS